MINAILTGIFNIVLFLVNLILAPIDALLSAAVPDTANALQSVANMFQLATSYLGFVVDMTGLSAQAIALIVMYFTFKLTYPLVVYTIKLAVKWYNSMKI